MTEPTVTRDLVIALEGQRLPAASPEAPLIAEPLSPMGTLALQLAAAGLHVFPCNQDKTPEQGIRWTRQATTNETAIRHWWGRSPDALPAIHLGKSNLVVLDGDRHGGPDGVAALGKLERDNEVLPNHPVINTAGGGEHHIFRQPEGIASGTAREP
jgi:hypothetical protein